MLDTKEAAAPAPVRINCEAIGRPKLLAEVTLLGLSAWCRICKRPHLIPYEVIQAAREKAIAQANVGC